MSVIKQYVLSSKRFLVTYFVITFGSCATLLLSNMAMADTTQNTQNASGTVKSLPSDKYTQSASWLRAPDFNRGRDADYINQALSRQTCSCDSNGNPLPSCDIQKIEVWADFIVETDGTISDVHIRKSSGIPRVDRGITYVIKEATLKPFLYHGTPVRGKASLPIDFYYEPAPDATCAVESADSPDSLDSLDSLDTPDSQP